jgi:hypothetical protein
MQGMRRAQLRILFHGLIVLLIGLMSGLPYGRAITHGWGDEAVRGWRLAHVSLVVGGIWLMVVAAVSPLLLLNRRMLTILVYSVVTSAYGFTLALVAAAFGGVRGLETSGPAVNLVAFLGNVIASLASLVWLIVMLVGTVAALRHADER